MLVAFASAVSTVAVLHEPSLACVCRSIVNDVSLFELSSHESDTSRPLPASVAASVDAAMGAISATSTVAHPVNCASRSPFTAAMR